jgi:hypothetical protein
MFRYSEINENQLTFGFEKRITATLVLCQIQQLSSCDHDARPVRQCQKLHRLAGDLVMRPLFDHQPARRHGSADMFTQLCNRAISVPGHVTK